MRRVEDEQLIVGRSNFVDDIKVSNALRLCFVRSKYAHAKINGVKIDRAFASPNVIAILTSNDIPKVGKPKAAKRVAARRLLPDDKVRYLGEPVAAVAAEGTAAAEDAAELVEVTYEPLQPLFDPENALKERANFVYDEWGENLASKRLVQSGDVDEAFRSAAFRLEENLRIFRQASVPIETRGILAEYDGKTGSLNVWLTSQNPHAARTQLSESTGVPFGKVRVTAPDVGGAFGGKGGPNYPEYGVACLMAMRTGRPVKWVESRSEHMQTMTHGRDQRHHVELAFDRNGMVTGLKDRVVVDLGVGEFIGAGEGEVTASVMLGNYAIKNFRVEVLGVVTNKAPLGFVRGAGRPEACFVIERMMDIAASELGIAPTELRFRNLIKPNEFPYNTGTGMVYDSGDYPASLKRALDLADYEGMRRIQSAEKRRGRHLGIGVACQIENSGPFFSDEPATVTVNPDGTIIILTGSSPHGQGHRTAWAQLCAQELGVPIETITVIHGDTAIIPEGGGTWGSRSAIGAGTAVVLAARALKNLALKAGAELLQTVEEELLYEKGRVFMRSKPEVGVDLKTIAKEVKAGRKLQDQKLFSLQASAQFSPKFPTTSNATNVALVEVDVEDGKVQILKYVMVHDCGRIINSMIVEGQLHGGIVHGIGSTLLEELVYDENGQLLTTTLMDYQIPSAMDIPLELILDHMETPAPHIPTGVKGMGESGTIGVGATIANAVADAIGNQRAITGLPLTSERIWKALRKLASECA